MHVIKYTGKVDLASSFRKFYSEFNNIMSVLGKCSHEMNAVHLLKTYCLPTLTYGLENALLTENTLHKIHMSRGTTTVFVTYLAVAGVKV